MNGETLAEGTSDTAPDEKPFEIGRVLADTFALIGERSLTVLGIALIVTVPSQLLKAAMPLVVATWHITSDRTGFFTGAILVGIVAGLMSVFGQAALVRAALAQREGIRLGFLETLSPALARLPAILAVALLGMLATVIGLLFVVVPGVLVSMMLYVSGPVLIAEDTGVINALRRSRALTRNLLGSIFLLMLAAGLGNGAVALLGGWLGEIFFQTDDLDYPFSVGPFLYSSLLDLLIAAFSTTLVCTLYAVLLERQGGARQDHLHRIFE
ncbi:MAG: hypothetical protein JF628_01295 [Sphingomonas sp.]|nr:hypothetical protein [Sphingomonas sp.]